MSDDPYKPPSESSGETKIGHATDQSPWETRRRVFLAWEKLRIVFNAILVPWTLACLAAVWPPDGVILGEVVVGGILANLLYLAAPTVESYIAWLGFESPFIRWGLFIAGTMFTMCLAAGFLFFASQ